MNKRRYTILLFIGGYFLLTLICFLVLALPFSRTTSIDLVDQIFLSCSIVSTTGLSSVDFGNSYSFFGQIVSLIFIQFGGVGYMALGSFLILRKKKNLPNISASLLRMEFNLPKRYPLLNFIYGVAVFTLFIEIVGAIVLFYGFKNAGVEHPLWSSIFHSISAFCTAGFSHFPDSLSNFSDNGLITNTILVLSILGSVGFIVLLDFWLKISGNRKNITLTSKIILLSTIVYIIVGTLLLFLSDGLLVGQGIEGLKAAFFQIVSSHTTVGFNNMPIENFKLGGILILIVVMIIGASPAGTGGGIKTTSITAILGLLYSILRQRRHITFFGKEIPDQRIYLAISSIISYSFIFVISSWIILQIDGDRMGFENLLFEVASALSTVGLSTGISADLSVASKILISVLMLIGRLGVMTFGFVLLSKSPIMRKRPQTEDLAI